MFDHTRGMPRRQGRHTQVPRDDARHPKISTADRLTISEIARRLGESRGRVAHIIQSRGIKPVEAVGGVSVFSDAAMGYMASELRRIDSDKALGKPGQAVVLTQWRF